MSRRVLPMGDRGLLVECGGDAGEPAGLAAAIRAAGLAGVVDVVPGEAAVLVTVEDPSRTGSLAARLVGLAVADVDTGAEDVVLPVTYDGPDLEAVAGACGLSVDEVVALHQETRYQVAFCGFAPGFAYLRGLDPRLHVPRRPEPRTRVPAGSVAVAGPYTAVYPRATPGGWHLLGTCGRVLWDPAAASPGVLAPGTRVRFEAT